MRDRSRRLRRYCTRLARRTALGGLALALVTSLLPVVLLAVVILPGTTSAAGQQTTSPAGPPREPPPPLPADDVLPAAPSGETHTDSEALERERLAAALGRVPLASYFDVGPVVSLYGYPGVGVMGELGLHATPEAATAAAAALAGEYDALNGDAPVLPALHLIVAVAQPLPMEDGSYLHRLDRATIEAYVRATAEAGQLLFLDVQIGWADPLDEVQRLDWALREHHVHLALDPEFATKPKGTVPGASIGSLPASDVNRVQAHLARIARDGLLPRKILVLHQFLDGMLPDPEQHADIADVEVVIDMDGYGNAWPKLSKYDLYALSDYADRPAIKLFYEWDTPILTPAELLALDTPPALVIYQ